MLEITGTEATLAAPDPGRFAGDIGIVTADKQEWQTIRVNGDGIGRGIGVVEMARALRSGGCAHRATAQLGLHVLDAMLATAKSMASRAFVNIESLPAPIHAVPENRDPTRRVV